LAAIEIDMLVSCDLVRASVRRHLMTRSLCRAEEAGVQV
jgi:hypothetical protein